MGRRWLWLFLLLMTPVWAQERPRKGLQGGWYPQATTSAHYLWLEKGRLVLEADWPETGRTTLEGDPGSGEQFVLRGMNWSRDASRRLRGRPIELIGRLQAEDLRVTLRLDGAAQWTQVWQRAGTPRLRLTSVQARGAGLQLEFLVEGRPLSVGFSVEELGSARRVHHELLEGGERIPMGARALVWVPLELRAGRYRLQLVDADPGLIPPGSWQAVVPAEAEVEITFRSGDRHPEGGRWRVRGWSPGPPPAAVVSPGIDGVLLDRVTQR